MSKRHNGFNTYLQYVQDNKEFYRYYDNSYEGVEKILFDAAHLICFADCTDIIVKKIVIQGTEVEYAGWQPNMLFEFNKVPNGETIYSRNFYSWEH